MIPKQRLAELVQWLNNKHAMAMSDKDNVTPQRYQDVIDALKELDELRAIVALDYVEYNGKDFCCHYCFAKGEHSWTITHKPDCLVLKYADYKEK